MTSLTAVESQNISTHGIALSLTVIIMIMVYTTAGNTSNIYKILKIHLMKIVLILNL